MTSSQRESLYFIYVNACNGYFYSEDLSNDYSLPPLMRMDIRSIGNKFKWIKTALELKSNSELKKVDTLRYDELYRMMSELDVEHEDAIEKLIKDYLNTIKK